MTSELELHLGRYLGLRRALGSKLGTDGRLLSQFVEFVERKGVVGPISARMAVEWACTPPKHAGAGGQARRLSAVRGFLTHLRRVIPETEVPARGLLATRSWPHPYIYSEAEMGGLLAAARSLGPAGSLRPHTYATLIGLVYTCGLRPPEAVRLEVSDLDLQAQPPLLRIRETKFRKSRLVAIHPSTADALGSYATLRQRLGKHHSGRFFVSNRGNPLNYGQVARTFLTLARQVGVRGPVGEPGCRLYDLRHSFAVRRVLAWYGEGIDVAARLPELSVYLGHVRPEYTYWYLTATPDLLTAAAERFGLYAPTDRIS